MHQPTHIHLVRHGLVDNPRNVVYGRMPRFRLAHHGIAQARQSAAYLRRKPVIALFSSPLLRARQSAREILGLIQLKRIGITQLITEVHSPYEGRPSAEVHALKGDVYAHASPHYEHPQDVLARTLRFFKRSVHRYQGRHVVAVTHGDIIVFAYLWALGKVLDPLYKGRLDSLGMQSGYPAHGSVTSFTFQKNAEVPPPAVSYWEPAGTAHGKRPV